MNGVLIYRTSVSIHEIDDSLCFLVHRPRFSSFWSSWCLLPVTWLAPSSRLHPRNRPRGSLAIKVTDSKVPPVLLCTWNIPKIVKPVSLISCFLKKETHWINLRIWRRLTVNYPSVWPVVLRVEEPFEFYWILFNGGNIDSGFTGLTHVRVWTAASRWIMIEVCPVFYILPLNSLTHSQQQLASSPPTWCPAGEVQRAASSGCSPSSSPRPPASWQVLTSLEIWRYVSLSLSCFPPFQIEYCCWPHASNEPCMFSSTYLWDHI